MPGYYKLNDLNDHDDIEESVFIRNTAPRGRNQRRKGTFQKNSPPPEITAQLAGLSESLVEFNFSYTASRHERGWIIDSLGDFFEQKWLDDILRLVKGGKEANVYQCLANPSVQMGVPTQQKADQKRDLPFLAAKVYRPQRFRNLKNDHVYREGRGDLDESGNQITDDGMLHAIRKRTEYGRQLQHTSWIEHEVKTMERLYAAGADVPRVYASGKNAILMAYIGDQDMAAPVLYGIKLTKKEARRLFERVLHNIEIMLSQERIHADLSAFNILYWDGEITLIDFPQAINPQINRNAYRIFERDVTRICEYFARQGVESEPRRLASQIWKAHHLRQISDVHPALLDAENESDQRYWQQWQEDDP